jgi:hypothetical protein
MSSVVGVGIAPQYQRPDPVKQHLDAARQEKQDEVRVEKRDENIEVLQARREQIKAPVVKGQGQFIDKEA